MKGLDIQKVPKRGEHGGEHDRERGAHAFLSSENLSAENLSAENFLNSERGKQLQADYAALSLPAPFDAKKSGLPEATPSEAASPKAVLAEPSQPKRPRIFKFKIAYVLVPFTIFVLLAGTIIGARFVNFAKSVSLSQTGFYQSVSNDIGSVLGNHIHVLKNLDMSGIARAIRNKQSINVLLLGYGGNGHSGAYLTDSIVVVHVDFATNQAAFISVPRDIWIKIPTKGYDGSYWKINAAYELGMDQAHYPYKLPQFDGQQGGGNMSKYVVSEVTGLPINYYVSMDFDGFQKIVDTLGGVEVNVENAFTDYSYPVSDQNADGAWCDAPDNTPTDCRYKVVHFDAGLQYMDGERALEYARSRHAAGIEGSDFARSKRQQKLMAAIEQKALNLGMLPRIFNLMDDVQGHFQTDLSLADIKDLSDYLPKVDFSGAKRVGLTDQALLVSSWSSDGQWILIPQAGMDDWNDVHSYIYDEVNGISVGPTKAPVNAAASTTVSTPIKTQVNATANEPIKMPANAQVNATVNVPVKDFAPANYLLTVPASGNQSQN